MQANPYNVQIAHKPNVTQTNFPYNIYGVEWVHAPAYFTRDIVNPNCQPEWLVNAIDRQPNPREFSKWGWTHFPNGYGTGNFMGHRNCTREEDPDPVGFVTEKTQRTIDFYANLPARGSFRPLGSGVQ